MVVWKNLYANLKRKRGFVYGQPDGNLFWVGSRTASWSMTSVVKRWSAVEVELICDDENVGMRDYCGSRILVNFVNDLFLLNQGVVSIVGLKRYLPFVVYQRRSALDHSSFLGSKD